MKPRYWSLAIVLVLINYLIFATLFTRLMETDFDGAYATRTPVPTFTPAPAEPFIIVPTLTPAPVIPTPTATRVLPDSNAGGDTLPAEDNSQGQIAPVVTVLVSSGPALVQPAADQAPPALESPTYQYTPTGWYDGPNQGQTRFFGEIKDSTGHPANGVFVRASCGYYSTISFPSGPVGWGSLNESADWPDGFYDITVDERPVPCVWILSVIATDDRETVKATLSEAIPVEITPNKSVIVANWRKNW